MNCFFPPREKNDCDIDFILLDPSPAIVCLRGVREFYELCTWIHGEISRTRD